MPSILTFNPDGGYLSCISHCSPISIKLHIPARPTSMDKLGIRPNCDFFLMGDMNIDYAKTNEVSQKKLKSFATLFGLDQLINDPTRYNSNQNNSTLDLIFTNSTKIFNAGVKWVNLSDHELVYATRKHVSKTKTKLEFTGRSHRSYDRIDFQTQLRNSNWNGYYSTNSPDAAWHYIKNTITNIIDQSCPVKTFKIKQQKEQWLSDDLLELLKGKDYYANKAKRTGNIDDIRIARHMKNQTKSLIKRAKSDYLCNKLEADQKDSKKFWRDINSVLPKNKMSSSVFKPRSNETNELIPDEMAAEYINNFFSSIGPNLAKNFKSPWNYTGSSYSTHFSITPFMPEDVVKLI